MRTILKLIAILGALGAGGETAFAQSACPYIAYGAVLTPAQWQSCFQAKADATSAPFLPLAGGTMTGEIITAPSTATSSGLNIGPGVAPSLPNNGDLFGTSSGLFYQLNGSTIELTGASSGSFTATSPIAVTFPSAGVVNYALNYNSSLTVGGSNLGLNLAHSNIFTVAQDINLNGGSLPTAQTGAIAQLGNAASTISRLEIDSFAASAHYSGVRADGTVASPTALVAGDEIAGFNGFGFNGTSNVGPYGSFRIYAQDTWSSTLHGTYADIATTPGTASASLTEVARFENDGGITVPSTVTGGDKGAGTINLSGGLYVNGAGFTGFTGSGATAVLATSPSISGLTVTGSLTATGLVTLADLATQNANTVLANVSGSLASPSAASLPGCTGAASALQYTLGTGFSCGTITASASSITYGTTTAGTSVGIPYNTSNGGTLAALTPVSGGIIGATSGTTPAYSAALAQYGVVYGGGAGATPSATVAGTGGQLLIGQSGAPAFETAGGDVASISAGGSFTFAATNTHITTLANLTTVGTIGTGIWQGSVISATYLPTASSSALGVAKCDNTTITCSGGTFIAIGAAATSIGASGTTTSLTGTITGGYLLYNNGGYVGNESIATALGTRTTLPTVCAGFGGTCPTSGSGTYTTPNNVLWIEVVEVGGGAGGGGSSTSTNGGAGGTGGTTTFGTSLLTANGGVGGGNASVGGVGGTASGGTVNNIQGGHGSGSSNAANGPGGGGGGTLLGGVGGGGGASGNAAIAAVANSGGGGGGAGGATTGWAGAGGGGGGGVDSILYPTTNQTYSWAIGAGGTAGTAGTSGFAGGAGGSGYLMVIEHYGS